MRDQEMRDQEMRDQDRVPRFTLAQRVLAGVAAVAIVLMMAGCGDADSSVATEAPQATPRDSVVNVAHQQAAIDDVDDEAEEETREDAGTVDPASGPRFWETVRSFPIWETTRLAPDPPTLEHLIGRSDTIV